MSLAATAATHLNLPQAEAHPLTRRLRLTREGWCWLGVAALLWTTGIYKGINLLTLLGTLMGVACAANAFIVRRRLRGLTLRRWLEGQPVAGQSLVVKVEVTQTGRAEMGLRVFDGAPGDTRPGFILTLSDQGRQRLRRTVTFARRGRQTLGPAQVKTGYPWGLVEREIAGPEEGILVHPLLLRLRPGVLRRVLGRACLSSGRKRRRPQQHPAAQTEFHSLRAFRPGDSPRLIHWRTSARRSELMVREFEDTPGDNLVLVVDPWQDGSSPQPQAAAANEAAERAISAAAAICQEWCRQPGDRLVVAAAGAAPFIMAGLTGPALEKSILDALACLEKPAPGDHLGELATLLLRAELPTGAVLVLTAKKSELANQLTVSLQRRVMAAVVGRPGDCEFLEEAADAT